MNLKLGKVLEVKKHPDSEKLYVLQVDLGSEKRQIVSGLQQIYKENELHNRKVVVIANLKPAKLAGYDSCGMILACEDPVKGHSDCGLLTSELKTGENIKCDKFVADNDSEIKIKIFQDLALYVKSGKVYCDGKELKGLGVDRGFEGKVC